MNPEFFDSKADFLEKMRRQFDFGPYPRVPLEQAPKDDGNEQFVHNLITPYYLRHRKTVNLDGKILLDAGCGTGYKALVLAKANPGAKVVGVDISPKSIDLARQRLDYHGYADMVEFHVLAIEDLPQLGMKFDYINCDEVLYFFDDIAHGLAALKSVLSPSGIIRTNLHNQLQRGVYFQAQELFSLMGLMEDESEEFAMPVVVETMKALRPQTVLKQRAWKAFYEDENNDSGKEELLANHLLKGDKGYRVGDLFEALNRAGLDFLSMTNWRHWNVADLFVEPDNLPAYLAMGLADSSPETTLTMYELLNPVHRLMDFWCTHPRQEAEPVPVEMWTLSDWQTAQVTLHPQLQTEAVREAAVEAIQTNGSFIISTFLSLPTLSPVTLSYDLAALLLQLWNGPKPFTALVDFWQRTHPINLLTLESTTPEAAAQQVADALGRLEVFLYVLPEQIG